MIRTGIFGGTFDPPHLGHLAIARAAIAALGLDEVFWMVTPDPPHKTNAHKTSFGLRFAMSKLCASIEPKIIVSDFENQRPGPHFTADTITLLKAANPDRTFSLLIGGDSLVDFNKWHDPRSILADIEFLGVFSRGGSVAEQAEFAKIFPDFLPKLVWIESDPIAISSSHIRTAISRGEDVSRYVHPRVLEFIHQNDLYRGY